MENKSVYTKSTTFNVLGKAKKFTAMMITPSTDPTKHDSKKPLDPRTGQFMRWSVPNCMTLPQVNKWIAQLTQNSSTSKFLPGILLDKPLVALDVDNIADDIKEYKDKGTGLVADLIALTKTSYCEISQSGNGIHIFYIGKKIRKICRKGKFELYDSNRWITLTQNIITSDTIQPLSEDDEIKLESYLFGDTPDTQENIQIQPIDSSSLDLNTYKSKGNGLTWAEIRQKIEKSKQSKDFTNLMSSIPSGDHSELDLKLVGLLTWWTNHDLTLTDTIFRKSSLMRTKWDEIHYQTGETYGEHTLAIADTNTKGGYIAKNSQSVYKVWFNSLDDLYSYLTNQSKKWIKNHTITDENGISKLPKMTPRVVLDILEDSVAWALPYAENAKEALNLPIHFYNPDTNLYDSDSNVIDQMINAIDRTIISSQTRKNIRDTLKADRVAVPRQLSKAKNHNLVACNNGVFNTKTKIFEGWSQETLQKYCFTQKIATNYSPLATKEPTFDNWKFSHWIKSDIAQGDTEKIDLIFQTILASVMGAYWLRKAVLLIDDDLGHTGKSTFEELIQALVGQENYASVNITQFDDSQMMLNAVGKQVLIGDDFGHANNNKIKDSSQFKNIVSNGPIRIKKVYENPYNLTLNAFVIQAANGMPNFADTGSSIYDRMTVIKFTKQYDFTNANNVNVKTLYIHKKELLEWLLNYVLNNVNLGVSLPVPQDARDLLLQTRTEQDSFKNFIDEYLIRLKSTVVPSSFLYHLYELSCSADKYSRDAVLTRPQFKAKMIQVANQIGWHFNTNRNSRISIDTFDYKTYFDSADDHDHFDDFDLEEELVNRTSFSSQHWKYDVTENTFKTWRGNIYEKITN